MKINENYTSIKLTYSNHKIIDLEILFLNDNINVNKV
jgi:hypothetical protein